MGKWTEYDPHTGITEVNDHDELSGVTRVTKLSDAEPLVERNKSLANSGATDKGIKSGIWHYMSIPVATQYEILVKHGINCQNRNHYPALFRLVNEHYPYLKTTHKHHSMKGDRGKVYAAPKSSRTLAS